MDRAKVKDRVITAMAIIGFTFAIISLFGKVFPSDHTVNSTPGNSSIPAAELVSGFAQEYVTTFLTAKAGEEQALTRYVTLKNVVLPAVRGQFTDVRVNYMKQEEGVDGLAVWKVIVSGLTAPQSSVVIDPQNSSGIGANNTAPAETERKYYRVFISVLDNAPRAVGRPVPADKTDIGVDLRLAYRYDTNVTSKLGNAVSGFLTAYLTEKNGDYNRYVVADMREKPVRPAPYVRITVQNIQSTVDNNGDGAKNARLYVTFLAYTKNNATVQLDCPLTLRAVEGSWQVEAIDGTPALQLKANDPSNQTSTTTTTATTSPPPATRG